MAFFIIRLESGCAFMISLCSVQKSITHVGTVNLSKARAADLGVTGEFWTIPASFDDGVTTRAARQPLGRLGAMP
jgi:hypothetical protein